MSTSGDKNTTSPRPNDKEVAFLTLAYNRFYDLYEEMNSGDFWRKDPVYRLSRIRDAFSVYFELLAYPPIQWAIKELGKVRPPNEQMISDDLFRCIRHLLQHLPLFNSWEDIHFTSDIINWQSEGKSIDSFFRAHEGDKPIKFRVYTSNAMWFLTITLPSNYSRGREVWLKDIIPEMLGIKFCLAFMKRILDTQVESIGQPTPPDADPPQQPPIPISPTPTPVQPSPTTTQPQLPRPSIHSRLRL